MTQKQFKSKIKKGDTVVLIAGDDAGKVATVVSVFPKIGKVLITGVNVVHRHERKRKGSGTDKGQIVDKALPVALSNVAFVDPKTKKPSRLGRKLVTAKDGKKTTLVRVATKSGTVIE